MMTVEQVRAMLAPMNLRTVSRETGLHYNTVRMIATGGDPSYQSLLALSDFLERHAAESVRK